MNRRRAERAAAAASTVVSSSPGAAPRPGAATAATPPTPPTAATGTAAFSAAGRGRARARSREPSGARRRTFRRRPAPGPGPPPASTTATGRPRAARRSRRAGRALAPGSAVGRVADWSTRWSSCCSRPPRTRWPAAISIGPSGPSVTIRPARRTVSTVRSRASARARTRSRSRAAAASSNRSASASACIRASSGSSTIAGSPHERAARELDDRRVVGLRGVRAARARGDVRAARTRTPARRTPTYVRRAACNAATAAPIRSPPSPTARHRSIGTARRRRCRQGAARARHRDAGSARRASASGTRTSATPWPAG